MSELPAPSDAGSVEVLRAWIVGDSLQCAIQADAFPDPGIWGAVLADVVRHIASAIQQQEGAAVERTVERILQVFHEEMGSPAAE
ncbi:MAG TPA: DUF5076 domain-containing protein [Gemmataceae bacterium]|nr:DUF5076 domain-containing protein [Gemmataceae bacterium]